MNRTLRSLDTILLGDCVSLMARLDKESIDFVLTDPPYMVNYYDRQRRSVVNDDNDRWIDPAFAQIYRLLKPHSLCVSFYGWQMADRFITSWRQAGFELAGHIVFAKDYASTTRFLRYQHEQAYLLSKGYPRFPVAPLPDVLRFQYSGNRLHPTQKPLEAMASLIGSFSPEDGVVLDPFAGSGTTLAAAHIRRRRYIGIELEPRHYLTATRRLERIRQSLQAELQLVASASDGKQPNATAHFT